jgi:hypothetical protein
VSIPPEGVVNVMAEDMKYVVADVLVLLGLFSTNLCDHMLGGG